MGRIKPGKNTSKKEVIIAKAAVLFRTKGFSATTMRELAEAVGIEAPSLYNHIGSKNEILQAICVKIANEFTAQLSAAENSNGSNIDKIEQIIGFHISMMLETFDEVYVVNHEWKHLPEPFFSNFLNQRRQYEKRLVTILEEGIKKKEFKNINPYVAMLTLLSAVRGLEYFHRHKKNISIKVMQHDMVTHLLKGMIK